MLASRKRAKPSSNLPQDCRLARQANDSFFLGLVQFLNGVDARRRYESIPLISRKLLSWRGILFSLSAIQEVAEPRKQLGLTQYPPKPSRRPKLLPLEYPYGGRVGVARGGGRTLRREHPRAGLHPRPSPVELRKSLWKNSLTPRS